MRGGINHFAMSCLTCQRNRAVKRATWGDAQVIGTPDFCLQHLRTDWTFDFPPSKLDAVLSYDSILTVVNRLSDMCRFVPARPNDFAEETAVHLINNVIRHHGCPEQIIADNDTQLRAGIWQASTRPWELL